MRIVQLNDSNSISFYETPWNNFIFDGGTNEIDSILFDSVENGNELLSLFEKISELDKIKYSSIRINPDNKLLKNILEDNGYANVETSIKAVSNINQITKNELFNKFKFSIEKCDKSDLDTIKYIAESEFKYGRFSEDCKINPIQAKVRNSNWIDSLYQNSNLIVGKVDSNIFGFMAFKISDSRATLELGGVNSNYSQLAYPFWCKVFEKLKEFNVKSIDVMISASNIGIINLYSKFGFKFSETYFGYRKIRTN